MRTHRVFSNAAIASVLAMNLVGCGSHAGSAGAPLEAGGAGGAPAADGGGAAGGASSGEPDAGPAHVCDGPGFATAVANLTFSHLSATVVDAQGAAVGSVSAQACGTNLCLNGTTDDRGHVTIDATATARASGAFPSLTKPAFKYGGGISYVKFALPLSGTPVSVDLGDERTFAFDAPALGAPLTPGTTATSNGVSLVLPADMNPPSPDPFDFDTPDLQKFRAVLIPKEVAPKAVDPSLGFSIVVGLAPNSTALCPPAKLRIPNSAGWAAGAKAEFFVHGIDVDESFAPYGGWAKASNGTVSADATTIETDDDGGLPILSVVGVRQAP